MAEKQYKWTDEVTNQLIKFRSEHDALFTGKRHTAKKAWGEILKMMGLEGHLTSTQVSKKWDNLKRKYKELRNPPTGTGTDGGEATAATWPWFSLMHEAIGRRPSMEPPVLMDLCVGENHMHVTDVAPSCSGSSSSGAGAATCGQACEEEDSAQPGTSSCSTTEQNDEPSTSICSPPRKQRTTRGDLLAFLKEEAKKEDERFKAAQENSKRIFDLFENLVKKD